MADVTSTLTSYKIAGKGEFDGEAASCVLAAAFDGDAETALLGYDQFGTALKATAFTEEVTTMAMTCVTPTVAFAPATATTITTTAKTESGEEGYGAITINAGGAKVNKGEAWSLKLSTGQTLTVTATSADGTAAASATWKASLS